VAKNGCDRREITIRSGTRRLVARLLPPVLNRQRPVDCCQRHPGQIRLRPSEAVLAVGQGAHSAFLIRSPVRCLRSRTLNDLMAAPKCAVNRRHRLPSGGEEDAGLEKNTATLLQWPDVRCGALMGEFAFEAKVQPRISKLFCAAAAIGDQLSPMTRKSCFTGWP
jgi:hypothetical protein